MSILKNIDDTLNDGSIFVIKRRFIDTIANDVYRIIKTAPDYVNERGVYRIRINTIVRNLIEYITFNTLRDVFGFTDNELYTFVSSDAVGYIEDNYKTNEHHIHFDDDFVIELKHYCIEYIQSQGIDVVGVKRWL